MLIIIQKSVLIIEIKTMSDVRDEYSENTRAIVFDIARMARQEVLRRSASGTESIPVIVIDGPAGIGKTTFTCDLLRALSELDVIRQHFDQDRFGMDRAIRNSLKISPCADFSRDYVTPLQLAAMIRGESGKFPLRDKRSGERTIVGSSAIGAFGKEEVTDDHARYEMIEAPKGGIIVYEGVSSLSGAMMEHTRFPQELRDELVLRVFIKPDEEAVLEASRLKRDVEERGADAAAFRKNWNTFQRNNWLYTMRGLENANIVITRRTDTSFSMQQIAPVCATGDIVSTESAHRTASRLLRQQMLTAKHEQWFDEHFREMSARLSLAPMPIEQTSKDDITTMHLTYKESEYRASRTLDDFGLMQSAKQRARSREKQALMHDERFNDLRRMETETAFASVILSDLEPLMPVVLKVSAHMLEVIGPVLRKFVSDAESLTEKERNLVEFFIEPMRPNSNELGRMILEKDQTVSSDTKIATWLLTSLASDDPATLYTHLRCNIRYSHFMSEEAATVNPEAYDYPSAQTKLSRDYFLNLHAKLDPLIKSRSRQRLGRYNLSKKFGIISGEERLPALKKHSVTMPLHYRAQNDIIATFGSFFNKTAASQNIPLVASPSGAMMHLLIAASAAELSSEEMQSYHLVVTCYLIGGGFHSLGEAVGVSAQLLDFPDASYHSLIPEVLHARAGYCDFLASVDDRSVLWLSSASPDL